MGWALLLSRSRGSRQAKDQGTQEMQSPESMTPCSCLRWDRFARPRSPARIYPAKVAARKYLIAGSLSPRVTWCLSITTAVWMSLWVCCGLHGIVLCVDVRPRYSTVLAASAFSFSNDNDGPMGSGGQISLMPGRGRCCYPSTRLPGAGQRCCAVSVAFSGSGALCVKGRSLSRSWVSRAHWGCCCGWSFGVFRCWLDGGLSSWSGPAGGETGHRRRRRQVS